LEEDQIIGKRKLGVTPQSVRITPVESVFSGS
jgi:hypothetical protein